MRDLILTNLENRSAYVSDFKPKDHLKDYANIISRLEKELNNWKSEPYTRTKEQIEYHLRYIKRLERV